VTCDFNNVVVVLPTYNERENLPQIVAQLDGLTLPYLRILVVDDNSPDGTGQVADRLASASGGRLTVLHRTEKDGLGRAYVAGFLQALSDGAEVVIQMDADLSHPASAIPVMLDILTTTDAAAVIGSRYVAGGAVAGEWGLHRKALSAWANFYVNTILRLRVRDATAGFKAWRASTLEKLDLDSIVSSGYAFQVEMNYRTIKQGLHFREIPILFEERAEGVSKMSLGEQIESAILPWRLLFKSTSRKPEPQRVPG